MPGSVKDRATQKRLTAIRLRGKSFCTVSQQARERPIVRLVVPLG